MTGARPDGGAPDHDQLAELISRAVDDVEPRHALDDIRARTAQGKRRSTTPAGRWTYVLAGAAAAAAVVGGVAVTGLVGDREAREGSPAATPTIPPEAQRPTRAVPVYYLVDTERAGARLVREFRAGDPEDPLTSALGFLQDEPLDPDYRSAWPAGSFATAVADGDGRDGLITVTLSDPALRDRPQGMSRQVAEAALEQVIWTLQGVEQARMPVQFRLEDNPVDQVLGVPTSEPLAQGETLKVLNHLNITTPEQGATVSETLRLTGVANTFEADVAWEIRSDDDVVRRGSTRAGWQEPRLYPFDQQIDLGGLAAGDYTIWATTYDPTGGTEGLGAMTDSKEFTIR